MLLLDWGLVVVFLRRDLMSLRIEEERGGGGEVVEVSVGVEEWLGFWDVVEEKRREVVRWWWWRRRQRRRDDAIDER